MCILQARLFGKLTVRRVQLLPAEVSTGNDQPMEIFPPRQPGMCAVFDLGEKVLHTMPSFNRRCRQPHAGQTGAAARSGPGATQEGILPLTQAAATYPFSPPAWASHIADIAPQAE